MISMSVRHRLPLAVLTIAFVLIAPALLGEPATATEDPQPVPAPVDEPVPEPRPETEPAPPAEEPRPDDDLPGLISPGPESSPQPETQTEAPALPALESVSATPVTEATEQLPLPSTNPCRQPRSFKEAWIDKLRRGVFYTVCGSAAWFDNFFGDEYAYDPRQVYGRISGGILYDAEGDWNERSKFDANIPLPNLTKRGTAFLGRDNAEQFISDTSPALSTPEAFRDGTDDRSWLAGFGYNPPGKRGSRMSYRLGAKVSTNPYVFAQARFRSTHYWDNNTALRFYETLFYRTNDDKFGSTTYLGYDWIPRRANLARISAQGTVSDDTDGLKWKSYATLYHDLQLKSGKPRGIAYQLLANGETAEDVPLREYGFIGVYREQFYREWLFVEGSLGYSWIREELDEKREGGITVGFVFEILFGDYYDRR